MKTYLVTGAAGFIGANFVKYMLKKYEDIHIVILDKLTYAGNLGTIKTELKDPRVKFVKGDIGNEELVSYIFSCRQKYYKPSVIFTDEYFGNSKFVGMC